MKGFPWKKRIIPFLLIVMLAACPTALAAQQSSKSVVSYSLWIGEKKLNSRNLTGPGWEFEPSTYTLRLDGFDYSDGGFKGENNELTTYTAIRYAGSKPLRIELSGENTIALGDTGQYCNHFGIYSKRDLTITGDGSLTVLPGACANDSIGIDCDGAVTVEGGSVAVKSGMAKHSEGIWCESYVQKGGSVNLKTDKATIDSIGLYVSGGDAAVSGGVLKAASGSADSWSLGVCCNSGSVTVDGGSVTAKSGKAYYSEGIYCFKGFVQNGGEVSLKANEAENSSYGLYVNDGDAAVSGGVLNAAGGKSNEWSFGIYSRGVTVSGGKVIAAGGAADNWSVGLWCNGSFLLKDGDVQASSGDAEAVSLCLYAAEGDITVEGGSLNAVFGASRGENAGIFAETGDLMVRGGEVRVSGGDVVRKEQVEDTGGSFGVIAEKITVKGGEVSVETGNCYDVAGMVGYSQGIYGRSAITVSGGSLTVKTGIANHESAGVFGTLTVKGGSVTVAAGGLSEETAAESEADFGSFAVDGNVVFKGGTASLSGETKAVLGQVKTAIDGSGWADAAGREGKGAVPAGDAEQTLEFLRIVFPAQGTEET